MKASRRHFVAGAALIPVVSVIVQPAGSYRELTDLVVDHKAACEIGARFLQGNPVTANELHHSIVRRLEPPDTSTVGLASRIADSIRRDFAERRVVRVDGWVLARTEAEICGLCALCVA